jgi:hypothetical protein
MKRGVVAAVCAFMVLAGGGTATAGPKPIVQHFSFESEPFFIDLFEPCEMQLVGFDTGVVTVISFVDESGQLSREILLQSLFTVLTNPETGKSIELHGTISFRTSFTWNPDGSLTIVGKDSGLNVLYKGGEKVLTLAGHLTTTILITFDKKGEIIFPIDIVEDFTPHLDHAFPLFCELLA